MRWLLFVLGALPQIVKLYAVHGLLWTKICASLTFSSFLAVELVVFLTRKDPKIPKLNIPPSSLKNSGGKPPFVNANRTKKEHDSGLFILAGSFVLPLYILKMVQEHLFEQHEFGSWKRYLFANVLILWPGVACITVGSLAMTYLLCPEDIRRDLARRPILKKLTFACGSFFVIFHLLAAVLHYSIVYDPVGTIKPSWTDQLG